MVVLSNDELAVQVAEHGAELSSIVAKATGKEYLWQADPAFWKRHSPVLFPIVVLIIMDVFLQKMRIKKGRKALIIEEAWLRHVSLVYDCLTFHSTRWK